MAQQRFNRWSSQLPLALVLISFLSLLLFPVLIQRRITELRRYIWQEINPAHTLITEMQLQLALEASGTRAYLLTGNPQYAALHRDARALRSQAYDRLFALASEIGPDVERGILALGGELRPADQLLNDLYAGRISRSDYITRLPEQQERFYRSSAIADTIQQTLDNLSRVYEARVLATERLGRSVTIVLTVFALLAALLVARLGSRYRMLAQDLDARARQQEGLTDIARQLGEAMTVGEVIQEVASSALRVANALGAYVEQTATSAPEDHVEVVAIAGEGTPMVGTRIPYPGSLSEQIIDSHRPDIVTGVGEIGQRLAPYLESSCPHCSGLIVPLSSESRVLGALVLLRGGDQPQFSHGEAAYIHVLGDLASAALRRVTLIDGLRESEAKFRLMTDHLRDIIWMATPDLSELFYVSPAFERIVGRSPEFVYSDPRAYYSVVHPEDRERVIKARLHEQVSDLKYRILRPDGEIRWIWSRIWPIRDEHGEVFRVVGISEDITASRAADAERERRLAIEREGHERITTILESITDAFYALDARWRFIYINHEAEHLLRESREELRGRVVWEAYPDLVGTNLDRAYHRALREHTTVQFEMYYAPFDTWFDVRVYPSDGGLSVFFRDVSERVRATAERERLLAGEREARIESEQRREELNRVSESRSRLMRGFSHDLKNPLSAADGYLQLLEEGIVDSLTPAQKKSVARVRGSIGNALNLIDDLLAMERAQAGEFEVNRELLSLPKIAADAVDEFRAKADARGLQLKLDIDGELPAVESDPARIRQVIGNLLSNAVKYTDHGGVTVRIAERERPRLPGSGRWIAVDVIDTGPGIVPNQQKAVFQEFHRLKSTRGQPGAGIGLAMSRSVARALHGEITLASEPGVGSTFTLWLPLRMDQAADRREAAD